VTATRAAAAPPRLVAAICTAQGLTQVGAFSVPLLLPELIQLWRLSNTEAGWILGISAATYMLAVPVLTAATDRVDSRWIYLPSALIYAVSYLGFAAFADGFWTALLFRALSGVGWAGLYMPGLKALSDWVQGPGQSRAVAKHAAAIGLTNSLSFAFAGLVAAVAGWRWSVALSGFGGLAAFAIVAFALPPRRPEPSTGHLLDFRPVLRNRSSLAYSICYCVHTWEMGALRNWLIAFLAFVAGGASTGLLTPTVIATAMGLLGTWASVTGNEWSIRFGRARFVTVVFVASMALAAGVGWSAALPYEAAVGLCVLWGYLIWSDSSSLTAGSLGSALPGQRGSTMAVHSTLGYAGGFLGPLFVGVVLDLAGGPSPLGWGLAFGHVALALIAGPVALALLRPADLAGDRPGK